MKWIYACKRPVYQLSLEKLTHHHFICSLHWVGGDGPTSADPYPLPADMNEDARNSIELAFQKRSKHPSEAVDERECTDADPNSDPSHSGLRGSKCGNRGRASDPRKV